MRRKVIWTWTKSQDFFCYCCIFFSFSLSSQVPGRYKCNIRQLEFLFSSVLGFSEHKLKCTTRLDLDYLCQLQFVFICCFFCDCKGVFCTWGCCQLDCKVTVSLCSQGMDCFDQVNQRDDQISKWNNHEPIFQSIIWKEGVFFFLCGERVYPLTFLTVLLATALSKNDLRWRRILAMLRISAKCKIFWCGLLPECTKNRVASVKIDCGCDAGGVPSSRFQVLPGLDAAVAVDDITGESW